MSVKRWTYSKTSVFNIGYHIIFCSKYRRPVLTGLVEKRLRTLLFEKAKDLDIRIEKMMIMSDHVHLFIKATPVDSPHFIIGRLKGYSSRVLREEFPTLKSRLPSLWTRSYFCESIGHISEDTVKKYIEEQKGK
jgi:putative transposase